MGHVVPEEGLVGITAFCDRYFSDLSAMMDRIDRGEINRLVDALLEAADVRANIFLLGNGGSAATASHWANDLMSLPGGGFRATSLADNAALVTAFANDHGYESVFSRQLDSLASPGDLVIAISASGNSPNVLAAVERANLRGAVTVGLTGFDGGKLRQLAQIVVHVDSERGAYGPVEDLHMVLDHLVTTYLRQVLSTR